jgi:hypothetical protein
MATITINRLPFKFIHRIPSTLAMLLPHNKHAAAGAYILCVVISK